MDIEFYLLSSIITVSLIYQAVVESCVNHLSRLTLRVLAEKYVDRPYDLLERLALDRRRVMLPVLFSIQLHLVLLALVVGVHFSNQSPLVGFGMALLTMVLLLVFFRQLLPNWISQGRAERVLIALLPTFRWIYQALVVVSLPLLLLMKLLRVDPGPGANGTQEDEATDEEIQAYLGVGEEEGIFERAESELIQSALEFGNTLVREIMTPRNEIVAIEETSSLAELRDLIVSAKHSRIPVYRERLDQIVGLVYVRNLLAHLESGREEEPITGLLGEVLIVPETKRVSELLKQMQANADQMAIVVNEYGTVSGLVTVEDLLEEIVGDIRDEDEFRRVDLVYEGGGSYIVRGNVEVEELEEALAVEFSDYDAATVSGLVVDFMGTVPAPGEKVDIDGVLFQVLSSDRRRIHTLRVRLASRAEENRTENEVGAD